MVAGVVTVGRHRYAVGLYWENSPGKGRVAQIAKEAAAQPGQQADFYAVRPGNPKSGQVPQFGLCTGDAGQTAGMPALAGCLASQLPGSWAGAFRLNEGIVVTVVRDELVVPDGDLFFADEIEARDRLIQEIGFGGLAVVYAPEAWSIPGADTIPLSLILNDRRDITLRQVVLPQKVKIIIGSAVLGVVLVLGGVWLWQERADEAERTRQHDALDQARKAASNVLPSGITEQKAPEPVYTRAWENAPDPLAVIENCRQGLSQVPAVFAGWRLSSLKCSGTAISLVWGRERGATAIPPDTIINDTLSTATRTISLPPIGKRGTEVLGDSGDLTKRYLSQNWSGGLNKTVDDPLPVAPAGYTGTWNPPPPPWIKRSFTLTVSELPSNIPELISGLPGVVINNMNYTPNGMSGAWSVEGVIYENRK